MLIMITVSSVRCDSSTVHPLISLHKSYSVGAALPSYFIINKICTNVCGLLIVIDFFVFICSFLSSIVPAPRLRWLVTLLLGSTLRRVIQPEISIGSVQTQPSSMLFCTTHCNLLSWIRDRDGRPPLAVCRVSEKYARKCWSSHSDATWLGVTRALHTGGPSADRRRQREELLSVGESGWTRAQSV